MKVFVYLLVIITLTSYTASLNPNIVNGQEATENQFPYQVALVAESDYITGHLCGGSLITPTFIITAAHCLNYENHSVSVDMVSVLLGSIYRGEGIWRNARNFIIHPEWVYPLTFSGINNDIALIQIDYVYYSDSIMNIALPDISESYPDYEASVVITSGWGLTNSPEIGLPVILRYTTLLVIRMEACAKILGYENETVEDYICAASPIDSGICGGDSGGPLVHSDSMVLIGIVSSIKGSCTGFYLSFFTRITYHRQWIWEMIGI